MLEKTLRTLGRLNKRTERKGKSEKEGGGYKHDELRVALQ